jgi:O-antigen ligase
MLEDTDRATRQTGARCSKGPSGLAEGEVDRRLAIIVSIAWVQSSIVPFIVTAGDRLNPFVSVALAIAGILFLVVFGVKPVLSRLSREDYLFAGSVAVVFAGSALVHPLSAEILAGLAPVFFGTVLPLYFLGKSVRDFALVITYSYRASLLAISVNAAYSWYLVSGHRILVSDNMDSAYKLLPSVLLVCFMALWKGGLARWLIAFVSIGLLVAQGTRGPLVCVGALFVLYWLVYAWRSPKALLATLGAFGAMVFAYARGGDWVDQIAAWLEGMGLSGRVIRMAQQNDLANANGRDIIQAQIWDGINSHPFLGSGIGGDRLITQGLLFADGTYAHNLLLEVLAQFGYIAGAMLICVALAVILRALLLADGAARGFIVVCISMNIKLMMSGSYLEEPFFFLLLGFGMSCLHSKNGAKFGGLARLRPVRVSGRAQGTVSRSTSEDHAAARTTHG